ncbi:MAG: hypothetical protein JXK94_03135 [Deltaproteobacteria bacterium]|nr:hypothetical protein [Deltaproteobacteria bacterium]
MNQNAIQGLSELDSAMKLSGDRGYLPPQKNTKTTVFSASNLKWKSCADTISKTSRTLAQVFEPKTLPGVEKQNLGFRQNKRSFKETVHILTIGEHWKNQSCRE